MGSCTAERPLALSVVASGIHDVYCRYGAFGISHLAVGEVARGVERRTVQLRVTADSGANFRRRSPFREVRSRMDQGIGSPIDWRGAVGDRGWDLQRNDRPL
jgi:hypothetical protein